MRRCRSTKIPYYFILNYLFLLVLFCLIPLRGSATEFAELYRQANELYQQEKYKEAIDTYQQIINGGFESWEVYYNLGNAYFRYGDVGRAILNYKRAKRLAPQNTDILHNLKIASLSIADKIEEPPQFFVIKVLNDFLDYSQLRMNFDQLAQVMLVVYMIFMILVIIRIFVRNKLIQRRIVYIMLPVLLILVIFFITFQVQIYSASKNDEAIIIVDKVDVMSSPSEDATQVFTLHQGVKVKIEKTMMRDQESWAEIRLTDGKSGWILVTAIERI